jgi:hypothetical protein
LAFHDGTNPDQSFTELIPCLSNGTFLRIAAQLEEFVITRRNSSVEHVYLRKCRELNFTRFTDVQSVVNALKPGSLIADL